MSNMSDVKQVLRDLLANTPDNASTRDVRERMRAIVNSREVRQQPFVHMAVTAAAGLAPAADVPLSVEIPQDFLIQAGTYFADVAGAAQTDSTRVIPLVTVVLSDIGTSYNYSDVGVPVPSLFGTGEAPYIWPTPRFIPGGTRLGVRLVSFRAAAGDTYNLRLGFHGHKLLSGG